MPGTHPKVGGDMQPINQDDINQKSIHALESMSGFFEDENARRAISEKQDNIVWEQTQKSAIQSYRLKWAIGVISIIMPWAILLFIISGIQDGDFKSAHVAAQALLVSGAFISLIFLYGIMLRELFKSAQGKQSVSSKNNGDIPEELKEILAILRKQTVNEESRQ